jgi:tRNA G18 (ribose-2'-O)-methylase SpoU
MRRALTTPELRRAKLTREEFLSKPRRPITVVLDGVSQNYNIGAIFGAIFRLCDAFLVQQLVVCGTNGLQALAIFDDISMALRRCATRPRTTQ